MYSHYFCCCLMTVNRFEACKQNAQQWYSEANTETYVNC